MAGASIDIRPCGGGRLGNFEVSHTLLLHAAAMLPAMSYLVGDKLGRVRAGVCGAGRHTCWQLRGRARPGAGAGRARRATRSCWR